MNTTKNIPGPCRCCEPSNRSLCKSCNGVGVVVSDFDPAELAEIGWTVPRGYAFAQAVLAAALAGTGAQ